MLRCSYVLAASLLVSVAPTFAQDKVAADHKPGDVEITFANGSTVRMIIETPALEVRTPYGKLAIPAKDLKQIEFGARMSDEVERQTLLPDSKKGEKR